MSEEGWARSYRGRWTHPVFRSLLHAAMWAWMTDTAAWRDTQVRFCDRVVTLERGQLITSERFMADGFEVNRIVVRKLLETLEIAHMIARHKAHGGTVITICNYDRYQSGEEADSPPNSPPQIPGVAHAEPTRSPNKKEEKNLRREERDLSRGVDLVEEDFREWYGNYPRRVDPGRAAKAYRAARKIASAADLLGGALRYRAECDGREPKFIKHPATWLNARSWESEGSAGFDELGLPKTAIGDLGKSTDELYGRLGIA